MRKYKNALPSKILPARKNTLAGWMPGDDHSIVVNKGVRNILDFNVCTILVTRFKASMLEFWPLIDWTTFSN